MIHLSIEWKAQEGLGWDHQKNTVSETIGDARGAWEYYFLSEYKFS